MPKVTGGLLDEPYPIKTRGDVSRSRVLPLPRATTKAAAPKAAAPVPTPAGESEQPKGGFDYVVKRNRMMKSISGRARRSSGSRRA